MSLAAAASKAFIDLLAVIYMYMYMYVSRLHSPSGYNITSLFWSYIEIIEQG